MPMKPPEMLARQAILGLVNLDLLKTIKSNAVREKPNGGTSEQVNKKRTIL